MKSENCTSCKKSLSRDEIGITKKLLGKDTKSFFCLSCLAEYLDCATDDLLLKIEEFKEEGCTLFTRGSV